MTELRVEELLELEEAMAIARLLREGRPVIVEIYVDGLPGYKSEVILRGLM